MDPLRMIPVVDECVFGLECFFFQIERTKEQSRFLLFRLTKVHNSRQVRSVKHLPRGSYDTRPRVLSGVGASAPGG